MTKFRFSIQSTALFVRLSLIVSILLLNFNYYSQSVSGIVFEYHIDDVKLLKKAKKNLIINGPSNGAKLSVSYPDGKSESIKCNDGGHFEFDLNKKGTYRLKIKRRGYSSIVFNLDNQFRTSEDVSFNGYHVFLRKEENPEEYYIGKHTISSSGNMSFSPGNASENDELIKTNISLAKKACKIKLITKSENKKIILPTIDTSLTSVVEIPNVLSPISMPPVFDSLTPLDEQEKDLSSYISNLKSRLNGLSVDDPSRIEMERNLKLAEDKLANASKIIAFQEKEISMAGKLFTYGLLLIFALLILAALLMLFLEKRKNHITDLEHKNAVIASHKARIEKNINYAAVIQKNYLTIQDSVTKSFEDHFIFSSAKDVVSGDFYWLSKVKDEVIVVAADCTGHGVSGAMLTMLGHSLLKQIISEKKITDPAEVLSNLHEDMKNAFKTNPSNESYGMDAAVVNYNTKTNKMVYSGALNKAYLFQENKLSELKPSYFSVGDDVNMNFEKTELTVKKGDAIFLFSDGFADQFKGGTDKIEKYNSKQFKATLTSIEQNKSFNDASKKLSSELNSWKGNNVQTDDVLVIGLRF